MFVDTSALVIYGVSYFKGSLGSAKCRTPRWPQRRLFEQAGNYKDLTLSLFGLKCLRTFSLSQILSHSTSSDGTFMKPLKYFVLSPSWCWILGLEWTAKDTFGRIQACEEFLPTFLGRLRVRKRESVFERVWEERESVRVWEESGYVCGFEKRERGCACVTKRERGCACVRKRESVCVSVREIILHTWTQKPAFFSQKFEYVRCRVRYQIDFIWFQSQLSWGSEGLKNNHLWTNFVQRKVLFPELLFW